MSTGRYIAHFEPGELVFINPSHVVVEKHPNDLPEKGPEYYIIRPNIRSSLGQHEFAMVLDSCPPYKGIAKVAKEVGIYVVYFAESEKLCYASGDAMEKRAQ